MTKRLTDQSAAECVEVENTSVRSMFEASAIEAEAIYESYRRLHKIYTESFNGLRRSLTSNVDKKKAENIKKAFENMSKSVQEQEKNMSGQLHAQGVVLLMGSAESIMKSVFTVLVLDNFRRISARKDIQINFSLKEVIKAKTDEDYGALLLDKIQEDSDPANKLNFLNMRSMKSTFKTYFNIDIPDSYLYEPIRYMQIRHAIVHNQGNVDENFLARLGSEEIDISEYSYGDKLTIGKTEYTDCFTHLILLFDKIDEEIERLKLSHHIY